MASFFLARVGLRPFCFLREKSLVECLMDGKVLLRMLSIVMIGLLDVYGVKRVDTEKNTVVVDLSMGLLNCSFPVRVPLWAKTWKFVVVVLKDSGLTAR